MTQEEKAKAYDSIFERLKEMYNNNKTNVAARLIYEKYFPELKESEDERIRKEIIDFVKSRGGFKGDWIAWLEKQGEQKLVPEWMPKFLDELRLKKNYFDWDEHKEIEGEILAIIKWMNPNYFNGKDCEQKVEPKFKVGDWIVSDFNNVSYIESVSETKYNLRCKDGYHEKMSIEYIDRCWHKWTVQDAKDGDVLYSIDSKQPFIYKERPQFISQAIVYCCINKLGEFAIWNTRECVICTDKYVPATKEQRDLLFQKMKEAGYEWDAENKELKKIEQKPAEWSEEDESLRLRTIGALETCKIGFPTKCVDEQINWLKSLRPQSQWKPSDEQMAALNYVVNLMASSERPTENDLYYNILKSLREQLKKLREE